MLKPTALALAALVATVGCSSNSHPKAPTPSLDSSTARQVYLTTVRPLFPATNTDDDLLRLGNTVCSVFRGGGNYVSLIAQYVQAGQDPTKMGELVASSVAALCPKYLQRLPGGTDYP